MNEIISDATRRNWEKLNKKDYSGKLTSRANKRLSDKQFIPLEYMSERANLPFWRLLLDMAEAYSWKPEELLYTMAVRLLEQKGILPLEHVQSVLQEYDYDEITEVRNLGFPENESDSLGLVYQAMRTEGEKNQTGSYYTKSALTKTLVSGLDFSHDQKLFDPCCGSGAFLLATEQARPDQLVGLDVDGTAVMIARCNLLLKFSSQEFIPQIFCGDYLQNPGTETYDYIVTNPPWGAVTGDRGVPEIRSRESFSFFLVHSYHQLKENGCLRFLLPESILNVKTHQDIRAFLLHHGNISAITKFTDNFSGVMTKYITLEHRKEPSRHQFVLKDEGGERLIDSRNFHVTRNVVFHLLTESDYRLVDKIRQRGCYTLENSLWALGIVTGDNKGMLKKRRLRGYEPIFTGKEIRPYGLKPAVNYIRYDRASLQQVAREELYRAPEKLVYRFISNYLMFAYDSTESLFLNSANILIPNIPGMSIKTVMAFLNSDIYQYLYASLFGEVKVLKGNLQELLFPRITVELDNRLSGLVDRILDGDETADSKIQDLLYDHFQLSGEERKRIQECRQKRRN